MVEKIKQTIANLTPRNRAIGMICLTIIILAGLICQVISHGGGIGGSIASTALGGLLMLIHPSKQERQERSNEKNR